MEDMIIIHDPITNQEFVSNEEALKKASQILNDKLDKYGFVYSDDPDIIKVLGAPLYPKRKFEKCIKRL